MTQSGYAAPVNPFVLSKDDRTRQAQPERGVGLETQAAEAFRQRDLGGDLGLSR